MGLDRSKGIREITQRGKSLRVLLIALAVAGWPEMAVANAGYLDTTFGDRGFARAAFGGSYHDTAFSLAIQADGRIVAAGLATEPTLDPYHTAAFARFTPKGQLDPTFGSDGKALIRGHQAGTRAVLIQDDDGKDKIVAAGSGIRNGRVGMELLRLDERGALDTSFGDEGHAFSYAGNSRSDAYALLREANGRLVAVGDAEGRSAEDVPIAVELRRRP